jgi:hypothetical protein
MTTTTMDDSNVQQNTTISQRIQYIGGGGIK